MAVGQNHELGNANMRGPFKNEQNLARDVGRSKRLSDPQEFRRIDLPAIVKAGANQFGLGAEYLYCEPLAKSPSRGDHIGSRGTLTLLEDVWAVWRLFFDAEK
jgi:hypothetical protein